MQNQQPRELKLLMLMLARINSEIQQLKQQNEKDKKEILAAIWAQDLRSGK